MDQAALLKSLNGHIAKYEQHRQYIEKARGQLAKFSSGVVEKVILDHEVKSSSVVDLVAPLLPEIRLLVAALDVEKAQVTSSKGGVDEQLQELELRQLIGEITDKEFKSQSAGLRSNAASSNERIAGIDASLAELNGGLDRWVAVATPHGHCVAPVATGDDDGQYGSRTDIRDDVSAVYGDIGDGKATVRVMDGGDEVAIEAGEVGEDVGNVASAEVQFGVGTEVDVEIGGDEPVVAAVESESEVVVAIAVAAEIAVEPVAEAADVRVDDGTVRRALLIYQESTAEEQIYPFTGEALTIGRGRENDIQIKNDSKVSRYHCKLFRRGNNFYVEDIKSSNGTLVNGELITDRRLFGGEEIVVGETYFRFRLME
ncbi:MAG: FHA domain-containing protein [Myxococcales bacterium]|nr:FHA domain-containing protein [Myxococcales bacterium]